MNAEVHKKIESQVRPPPYLACQLATCKERTVCTLQEGCRLALAAGNCSSEKQSQSDRQAVSIMLAIEVVGRRLVAIFSSFFCDLFHDSPFVCETIHITILHAKLYLSLPEPRVKSLEKRNYYKVLLNHQLKCADSLPAPLEWPPCLATAASCHSHLERLSGHLLQ